MSKIIKLYNTLHWFAYGGDSEVNLDSRRFEFYGDLYDSLESDDTDLAPYADSYHGDTYYEKLISTKITCEKINNTIFGVAECKVSDDWTDDDTA